jgi:hypothetical protein
VNTSVFYDALQEATTRLAEVTSRLNSLRSQEEHLQALVNYLQAVLADTDELSASSDNRPAPVQQSAPTPVQQSVREWVRPGEGKTWRLAFNVLSKFGPASVPKIHQRLMSTMENPPSRDSVRIAMLRKPETFNNDGGIFSIIEPQNSEESSSRTGELQWKEATEVAS